MGRILASSARTLPVTPRLILWCALAKGDGHLFCPAHLLLFYKPFADDLIDHGFDEASRDPFTVPIAITIIGNEGLVHLDIVSEGLQRLGEF